MPKFAPITLKGNKYFYLSILILLSLILLIMPNYTKTTISYYVFKFSYSPFYGLSDKVGELRGVYKKNQELEKRVAELTLENYQLKEQSIENATFRALLKFKSESSYKVIPAKVIAFDPGRNTSTVLVDVGEEEGIRRNMPVINMYGLVGKTIEVMPHTCAVQLLLDPNCRVAAIDQRSRILGIVKLSSSLSLVMDNVPLGEDIKAGDQIVTSGLGGIFPSGIQVGKVVEVEETKHAVFKTIRLKPEANFNSLEELFILDISQG
ncbi:MAG: rod shape-determining protein MreC [candidate division Zixibacteria bacterium]|nr:rod shape-determining protein MreC [candidate division Zixibacteria bacterium]